LFYFWESIIIMVWLLQYITIMGFATQRMSYHYIVGLAKVITLENSLLVAGVPFADSLVLNVQSITISEPLHWPGVSVPYHKNDRHQ
jgi:hypothetical protein